MHENLCDAGSLFWGMDERYRRYEVLLPTNLNDGSKVPSELIDSAVKEVLDRFGAASEEPESIDGHWKHRGRVQHDSLSKLVIDVKDEPENRRWMREFKSRWKDKLDQTDIWLISFPIDVE
jgi:hypothetical protein